MSVKAALALFFGCAVLLIVFGPPLQSQGLLGIAASEALLLAAPVLVAAAATRGGIVATLGLHRPRPRDLLVAALIGTTAWYALAIVVAIQEQLLPAPHELTEQLEALVTPRGSPIPYVLALGVVPGICEELLCRGVVARALRPKLGVTGATLLSAFLFAMLHLSIYRFLPTFLLGLVLAQVMFRTGSLWPAMLVHALNNSVIVLLSWARK